MATAALRGLAGGTATGLLCLIGLAAGAAELPELVAAAKSGDRARALTALTAGADVAAVEADGTTALHWAARFNDLELADRLLAAGADANSANRYGVTPLYLAALNGSAGMIERLLEAGADANEVGNEGETVLMTVAHTGVVAAADALLAHGAQVEARENWHGQTALMWAAAEGHPAMVQRLIEAGADVNALSNVREWERQRSDEPRDKWLPPGGFSALLYAAREGCTDCVPVLAESGADVNQTTAENISAVALALINGHYDTAMALLEAGTDPNIYDYTGRGALYAAADFNTMPMSNRPAPNVLPNEHSALDVMRLALEKGADPDAQLIRQAPYRAKLDRGNDTVLTAGTTALVRAAKSADLPAIELLLEHGADASLTTRNDVNALMIAAGLGNAEQDTTGRFKNEADIIATIDIMLDQGLEINAVDNRGRTALHGAALHGFDQVVAALAERGADLTVEDRDGFTALDTALGLAGGFGFTGGEGRVQESTVALIEQLLEDSE
ncbi:MAG TPA: ankyrin repeat domain-containing protein [Gammaproteobacteria bacterium]|jgi:ankyrin repeat protein